jgi:hypothetical protein
MSAEIQMIHRLTQFQATSVSPAVQSINCQRLIFFGFTFLFVHALVSYERKKSFSSSGFVSSVKAVTSSAVHPNTMLFRRMMLVTAPPEQITCASLHNHAVRAEVLIVIVQALLIMT